MKGPEATKTPKIRFTENPPTNPNVSTIPEIVPAKSSGSDLISIQMVKQRGISVPIMIPKNKIRNHRIPPIFVS